MADDVTLPGAGAVVATDEVAGRHFQIVKLAAGADGAADPVTSANPLPVAVQGSLALPSGAATETTLAAMEADTTAILARMPPMVSLPPDNEIAAPPVRPVGQHIFNASFSSVGAGVIDSQFITPIVGTGVSFSQAGGALAIVAGATANAEFLTRTTESWRSSMRLRVSTVLSQRIANNNMAVLLADKIGEGLTYTIVSATQVNVTKAAHGYTTQNVGQFMCMGGITGAAGIPGRYAIASIIDANTVQFTVAGWPASGSGTLSLFGHSYVRILFNGTTAAAAAVDGQRRGWATGDTTATINTTASPGTIMQAELSGRELFFSDALRASSTAPNFTARASRVENIPDDNLDLHLWLWSFNGSTAPASSTTWTISFAAVERFVNQPVYVQGFRANGNVNAPVVQVGNTPTVNPSGGALAAGTAAIGDVGLQARANATGAGTAVSIVAAATPAGISVKASAGRLLSICLTNTAAAARFVKFFNVATAPTMGTTSAAYEVPIPANGMLVLEFPFGVAHATGIFIAITGAVGLTNNTAVTANDVVGFVTYA